MRGSTVWRFTVQSVEHFDQDFLSAAARAALNLEDRSTTQDLSATFLRIAAWSLMTMMT
jgi:hypothetical protein